MLSGVAVGSNQTQMVRAEQIIDLGGGIYLDGETLVNETEFDLLDSFVVRKTVGNQIQHAVVGLCSAGSKTTLRYRDNAVVNVPSELPLQASRVMHAFLANGSIPPDSSRLVGRIEQSMSGMNITPQANQQSAQTIVVANLSYPRSPAAKPDVNLVSDFRQSLPEITESEVETQ